MAVYGKNGGLSVTAHVGDRAILLAFDIDQSVTEGLAGFAVYCTPPPEKGNGFWLQNRLSFNKNATATSEALVQNINNSCDSPFQLFHWVHFPSEGFGSYIYEVAARYFDNSSGQALKDGSKVSLQVDIKENLVENITLGMTRGFVSSQAYIQKFKDNYDLWPKQRPIPIDFDTTPYEKKYEYLGAHAREILFNFLAECKNDNTIDLDIFAFDLNEPDFIRDIGDLCSSGRKVRIFLDNSSEHGPDSSETKAAKFFTDKGATVVRNHFFRFAHDKVLIMKKNDKALKVLTGSANFSLRGLYVQANSILVFDNETIVSKYQEAFDTAWDNKDDESKFKSSPIASEWFKIEGVNPEIWVSFAPHETDWSLDEVRSSIEKASSSVLFALMTPTDKGGVTEALREEEDVDNVLFLGVVESEGGVKLFKPGAPDHASIVSFDYLKENIPPFSEEIDMGQGQHIHHKFVVCDFNGDNAVVFCGSSNLASGGEMQNGDNLIAIFGKDIATAYAIEAIRLYDHYQFRYEESQNASKVPLYLDSSDKWVSEFFDSGNIKCREREVYIK